MSSSYGEVFARSLTDPEGFWSEAAEEVSWIETWDKVLDRSNPPFYRWFPGGVMNTCYNAVDIHVRLKLLPTKYFVMKFLPSPVLLQIRVLLKATALSFICQWSLRRL